MATTASPPGHERLAHNEKKTANQQFAEKIYPYLFFKSKCTTCVFLSKLATHHYFVRSGNAQSSKVFFEGPDHFLSSSAHDIPLFCLNSFCYIYSIQLDLLFVNTFFDSFAVLVVFNKYFLIFSTFYYAFSHILSTVEIFFTIIGAREIIFTAFRKKFP